MSSGSRKERVRSYGESDVDEREERGQFLRSENKERVCVES